MLYKTKNNLNFREQCDLKAGNYNFLVFLFDVLSPVALPEKYSQKEIEINWDILFTAATNAFVAPLLYQRILERKLSRYVPSDFLESLEAVYDLNNQRNFQLKLILEDALKILNQGGITPTLLKGSHALFDLLPYSNCRMMGDIDILVPEEKIIEARDLLLDKGYYHEGYFNETNDLEKALQQWHAHISPLFHSSGYGYLELHRFPGFKNKHPELVKQCFNKSFNIYQTLNNCKFYSLPTKYLFLYNQMHHYYDALDMARYPDIRYVVEQGMLVNEFKYNELEEVYDLIQKVAPAFTSPFKLQNALLKALLCLPILDKYCELDSQNKKNYNDAVLLLLSDRRTLTIQKLKAVSSLVFFVTKKIFDPVWCKDRLFNLGWYKKSVLINLKNILKNNWTIRR